VADPEALDLETRRAVYQHLLEYPGLHLRELTREIDLSPTTVRYHLDTLVDADLVTRTDEDGYTRFYPRVESEPGPREVVGADEKELLNLLRQRVPLGIVLHLLNEGPTPQGELAESLDVARSTASYHLDKLQEAGAVTSERDGRSVLYSLVDPVETGDLVHRFEPPRDLADAFADLFESFGL
jgi:DNA-binding transcriptional ArsR family regulator